MSKVKTLLGGLVLTLAVGVPTGHAAQENEGGKTFNPSTTQAVFSSTKALEIEKALPLLVVTDSTGVKTFEVKKSETVSKVLSKNGLDYRNFNLEDGSPAKDSKVSEDLFLFRVEYSGSARELKLPAPVTKLRVNGLPEGTKIVQEEGVPGLGLMTTVRAEDLSQNKKLNGKSGARTKTVTTETLTVLRAPKPRTILVPTKKNVSDVGDFELPSGDCANGSSVPSTVSPDLIALHRATCILFPEVLTYGTYRDYCTYSCDHRDGYAVDIMVPAATGRKISAYLVVMAEAFNIYYLIYEQQIWTREQPYWRPMEDRGDPTANHFDHVHVSFNRDSDPESHEGHDHE